MKQTLTIKNFSFIFEDETDIFEENREFFDETFKEMCREISLTAVYKEFYLLRPFLRMFNIIELFIRENEENYRKTHPKLSEITEIFYSLKVVFHPKISEESNFLEIILEANTLSQGVFQDFFTVPKTFKMRIDEYART